PATLERARLTAPYGYVLKPFEDRDLQITIDMGLYRHRMERRVRESEQWLSATLKGISDCVVATNRDGTIRMLNQAAQGLAHTDASTAEDKHWSAILPLRDRTTGQPTPDLVLQAMAQGQTVDLPRECLLGAEGLPVEGSISPIFDLQNQVCGSVIVLRDIRQRLQLDKQIWESRKMEAARRLSGGISHEFNNALTSVIGFSEMLLENPLLGEQTRREYLKLLLNSARRAAKQTKQLAAFASGQMLSPCLVDLNKVLQDLWKWLQESLKPAITVELKRTMILGSIKSDPNQVVEAILALVENAREAMPSGGRLTLETAVVDVSREMAAEHHLPAGGRFARLSVTDTGRGISPEDLLRAFDPYFTTKPVGKGPGLGLSQVHGLCRQCGG
ncbi:MAG: PAS domain-containing protein, partial [Gemmataceae bacterium]